MINKQIIVKNINVNFFSRDKKDYISLTDIARYKNAKMTGLVISHWMSRRFTVEFMGAWEYMYNSSFNVTEFSNIKNEAGSNGYVLSGKQWISKTNAIGIISKAGRYGGTYAHKDIAFEFASWISPEFKLYIIKEFQRLKDQEEKRQKLGWSAKRMLTKMNYRIHTDAIKKHIVPELISKKQATFIYANEADMLNVALFGLTAKEWENRNKNKKGNIRDYADVRQLVCLANLESLNAEFIRQDLSQTKRLQQLNEIAVVQMTSLLGNKNIKKLKKPNN